MSTDLATHHIQELAVAGSTIQGLHNDAGATRVSAALVPPEYSLALLDREQLDTAPDRIRGVATFAELDPLVSYANRYGEDQTTVWVDYNPSATGATSAPVGSVVVVFDDHQPGDPAWGEHRALLPLCTTPEWQHWLSQDGVLLDQVTFSDHLRQGLPEITDPDHATILEVAEHLVVHETDSLLSVQRADGEMKIEHNVEQTARRAGGPEATGVPEAMTLRIAPFVGGDCVELEARLRWRKRGDSLQLGYVLVRPQEALRAAFHALHRQLVDELTAGVGERVYLGTAIAIAERGRSVRRAVGV